MTFTTCVLILALSGDRAIRSGVDAGKASSVKGCSRSMSEPRRRCHETA
jgi:hypothetical protein